MTNADFDIVPITEDYIDGFWAVVDSVARERQYLSFLECPPIESTRAFVQENLANNLPSFVAIYNNSIIGWCDISSLRRPVFSHSGLLGIGVISEFRGNGVGKALIKTAIQKAKDISLTRIELTVREENHRAISLYKSVGFEVEGLKKKSTRIDGVYSNDICMALLL